MFILQDGSDAKRLIKSEEETGDHDGDMIMKERESSSDYVDGHHTGSSNDTDSSIEVITTLWAGFEDLPLPNDPRLVEGEWIVCSSDGSRRIVPLKEQSAAAPEEVEEDGEEVRGE